jgi:hypothetical protein
MTNRLKMQTGRVPPGATVIALGQYGLAQTFISSAGTYVLGPGDWGDIHCYSYFSSEDDCPGKRIIYGQPGVKVNSISLDTCKNIEFRYITATGGYGSQGYAAFSMSSCRNCKFDHCYATDFLDNDGVTKAGRGMQAQSSDNCWFTWGKVYGRIIGYAMNDCTNSGLEDCLADHIQGDAFDLFGGTNNVCRRSMAAWMILGSNHPDSFQVSYGAGGINDRSNGWLLEDLNYDRENGDWAQGPGFADTSDNLTVRRVASFGAGDNGGQFSDCKNSSFSDSFMQGYEYQSRMTIRGVSDRITTSNITASSGSNPVVTDSSLDGANTNVSIAANNTKVSQATSLSDRSVYLAYLAANPTIPTRAHWSGQSYTPA